MTDTPAAMVERIHDEHQPADVGSRCSSCGEVYPCDAAARAADVLERLRRRKGAIAPSR